MIRRIDHISIAVRDLARAKGFFLDKLGGRELYSMAMADFGFRWTTIELGSSCLLELIDPVGEKGFVQRFLESHGEGAHHVTVQVDDMRETRRLLEERGIPTFGYSEAVAGWKEVFIHPKHAFGVLIQFAEFNPLDWIHPGYVPSAYREFVPPPKAGEAVLEVRRTEAGLGAEVEIRHGEESVKIPSGLLEELIRRLKGL
jgi:methylmalonyl-CoA/ethylmalonyl-CoA epimerase